MNRFTRVNELALTAALLLIGLQAISFTPPIVIAQSSKGIVVGTITDPTGAAISGRVNKAFKLPFEGHRLEVRVEFFNVFNHPNFTFANPNVSSDLSNGDVTNPFFNNVRLNNGGNRTGRIQVRYAF